MATPSSGDIGMGHFRSEITRGSGQISMTEVRTRYGGSGAISFSSLRKSEGFIITCGYYYASGKPTIEVVGYDIFFGPTGSVSPNESGSALQLGPSNSSQLQSFSSPANTGGVAYLSMSSVSAGYNGSDITRVVTANTSRTVNGGGDATSATFQYQFPPSGTLHCLIKF